MDQQEICHSKVYFIYNETGGREVGSREKNLNKNKNKLVYNQMANEH